MNRIAELRKSCGISQIALAKELGIAQNTLSQYEREVRNPTSKIVSDIAKIFSVTPNYVLGIDSAPSCEHSITEVTKVAQLYGISDVNLYLDIGWKLLHVGNGFDPEGRPVTVYSLGWYGDPQEVDSLCLAKEGDEQNASLKYIGTKIIDGEERDIYE